MTNNGQVAVTLCAQTTLRLSSKKFQFETSDQPYSCRQWKFLCKTCCFGGCRGYLLLECNGGGWLGFTTVYQVPLSIRGDKRFLCIVCVVTENSLSPSKRETQWVALSKLHNHSSQRVHRIHEFLDFFRDRIPYCLRP